MRAQPSATNLNHGTEGKTNKDRACRLKARIERISQNLTTLLDLCNNASRGIWTNNVSRRDGEPRPLAEAGHQIRPLTEAKHQATEQGEKVASKTSRDKGSKTSDPMESSQPENKTVAACAATSQRLAVTTKQPNAYGWAESTKTARVTLKITKN